MNPAGIPFVSLITSRAAFLPLVLPVFLMASCGTLGKLGTLGKKGGDEVPEQPFGPTGIPPELRSRSAVAASGEAIIPGGNVAFQAPLNITPEEDIIFTDPDNPMAPIPELATLLAMPSRGPWEQSATIARQRAIREGKPLLIWFTDSAHSPMCKALSEELFSTSAFEDWAVEKVIRLRVDANTRVTDQNLTMDEKTDREIELRNYVRDLKKRYKVLGHPSVLMLNPAGEVIGRYRGFKRGQADYFWGLIKHGEAVSSVAHTKWKEDLEKKGYRDWRDPQGRIIFAKLASYSNGELVLIEPDGSRARTRESRLSREDQDWIAAQKRLRNLD